jgi:hypothetical protein
MPKNFSGGCVCRAVRYTCAAEPLLTLNCHCADCQHVSGAAFVSGLIVPANALVVEGEPRWHEVTAESGHTARRGFCGRCGTQLFSESTASQGRWRGIRAASLDDASWFQPQMDIFTKSAQPWAALDPALPKFEAAPPREAARPARGVAGPEERRRG